jgi:hypothetical protein
MTPSIKDEWLKNSDGRVGHVSGGSKNDRLMDQIKKVKLNLVVIDKNY